MGLPQAHFDLRRDAFALMEKHENYLSAEDAIKSLADGLDDYAVQLGKGNKQDRDQAEWFTEAVIALRGTLRSWRVA